ncbi:MAG: response regulator containing a CheY-like receiver domain and an DNA-binding domain [Chitinophagaceae bacterium]|nr:response regulator containing a CheY-like receiver domain and an DNA-binding domain [Chitinophagaceae bacterium]
MKHKIVLADDHQFLMEGIISVLKDIPDIEIVATAQNGFELMDVVEQHRPGLVILDLNMPGYDGLQCLKKIKSSYAKTKVLVLTNYSQPELIEEVMRMEADGYVIKNSSSSELKHAIGDILKDKKYFPVQSIQKILPDDSYFFDEFLKKYQLTKREVEIIRMVCKEMSTKKIAKDLFLSELTVNTHRRNIFKKLDVKNVAGLINFARKNQLG